VRLAGHDRGEGWLTNSKGKALLYDGTADAFRNRETMLHSLATFTQLASIEGSTLRAPEGEPDDRAVAYALGCTACRMRTSLYIAGDILCNATLDPDRYSQLDDRLIIGDLEIDFSDNERDDGSAWWRR